MQNQYILIINLDEESKEKYKNEYIENGYNILLEEKYLIVVKKENDKTLNTAKEKELLEFIIKMLGKYKFTGTRIMDLSKDMNSMLKKVENVDKIDYKTDKQNICWHVRNIMTKEILINVKEKKTMNYIPKPENTDNIVLNDDLIELTEKMAKNTHENWAKQRISDGWKYGEKRDDVKKEHPCLIPYEELSDEEKEYDRITSGETLKLIIKLGYKIVKGDK